MPKRMLIDSSHPEETRVVVLDGQKVEEFDFEAASKRPLKGNIYLAKVTRVEPSLQAAFVEYGGNRQGFLAFSEIHPDYYQIPVADRMALLAEQEEDARRRSDDEFESFDTKPVSSGTSESGEEEAESEESESEEESESADEDEAVEQDEATDEDENEEESSESEEIEQSPDFEEFVSEASPADGVLATPEAIDRDEIAAPLDAIEAQPDGPLNEFAPDEVQQGDSANDGSSGSHHGDANNGEQEQRAQALQRPNQRWMRRRHYKIQEVIKRRQIILVQVVKEERGNKGAALTTYMSLAGRYCVLMPNTPRGGGISRKITNANDRKRLKSAAQALELPEGMGLIIRTAGENRTKVEIKRDYEYLLRMWDTIRELTLKSNAPACVYEEGDLIKRAIRDLYNKDVSEVVVEGEEGYRNAKDFMRMLMPSHAKNVKQYKEPVPLFQRLHIEAQLDAMFSPSVTLKSGGYIVINQTEALVAIDVNSGRATREHSIEDTAYKTNLEAADEVGRQLRLRDLAGLIVIDFIDMEDARNDRNVERRLRDAVKNDRARVQVGKISQFGLMEMSRQRLRAGVVAGSTVPCPNCGGQGIVRSVESTALRVIRALDEEGQRQRANSLVIYAPVEVAMYTLNQKRREIARMEQEYSITIAFQPRDEMMAGTFELERIGQRIPDERARPIPSPDAPLPTVESNDADDVEELEETEEAEEEIVAEGGEPAPSATPDAENGATGEAGSRRKRRRRRRGGRDRNVNNQGQPQLAGPSPATVPTEDAFEGDADGSAQDNEDGGEDSQTGQPGQDAGAQTPGEPGRRKRRRRRRGRRGPREGNMNGGSPDAATGGESGSDYQRTDYTPSAEGDAVVAPNTPSAPVWSLAPKEDLRDETPKRYEEQVVVKHSSESVPAEESAAVQRDQTATPAPEAPTRKGWWQRPFKLRD